MTSRATREGRGARGARPLRARATTLADDAIIVKTFARALSTLILAASVRARVAR